MIYKVDVFPRAGLKSYAALKLERELEGLGYKNVEVKFSSVYLLELEESFATAEEIAARVLCDRVSEEYRVSNISEVKEERNVISIAYYPQVMDNVALVTKGIIREMGFKVREVKYVREYKLVASEALDYAEMARKFLYNPLIEYLLDFGEFKKKTHLRLEKQKENLELKLIDLLNADESKLKEISKKGMLSLNLSEMKKIKEYFQKEGRNPTDCELETIAQTWSEHCLHKTFRSDFEYMEIDETGKILRQETISNLFASTIKKATQEIDHPLCVSVFEDNAGIIKFDKGYNVCFKVETHNHPSSLEPYGGASTGIGGVIRDILGTGRGAFPIANTDIFCFGRPDTQEESLPSSLLPPRRIIEGVVAGVRDYGNRMGIPTVAGAVLFEERFLGNPLVFCGNVGILPQERSFKTVEAGEIVAVMGGATGKDGIHGATFSSAILKEESTDTAGSAVQIGNPLEEKKICEAIARAASEGLFTAITDCGAGGFSSAVGEIAREQGVEVYLEKAPLKYQGLNYTEIWISESQERMVLVLWPEKLERLKEICRQEEVDIAVIGKVTSSKRLEVFYKGRNVCSLDMNFLHKGFLKEKKQAVWKVRQEEEADIEGIDEAKTILALLGAYNIASKDWIIRQYDHEVQAKTITKPLMGRYGGVTDAAIIKPLDDSKKGIVLGCGINPFYSDIDPYWMAKAAIDEAIRNVVSQGADFGRCVVLDNFCWGSAENKEKLGELVRAARGCYEYAKALGVPFISGKDSFYNEFVLEGKRIVIPSTLLISALGIIEDVEKASLSFFQKKANLVYAIGVTKNELGGSEVLRLWGRGGGFVPKADAAMARTIFQHINIAQKNNLIESCHDISEGGLGVCLAEMCIGGNKGVDVFLSELPQEENISVFSLLFSESPSRFIVEVKKENKDKFEKIFSRIPFGLIGCVGERKLRVYSRDAELIVDLEVEKLRKSWKRFENGYFS